MEIRRHFTDVSKGDVFEGIEWEIEPEIVIRNKDGTDHFRLKTGEFPKFWSSQTRRIVASKYFKISCEEYSVKQLINRVVDFIANSGASQGYFSDISDDEEAFKQELKYILVHQYAAFNSPVWFNCGVYDAYGLKGGPTGSWTWDELKGKAVECKSSFVSPQVSACFIVSEKDDLMSIADGIKREMRLFKFGSGVGANFSSWRSRYEPLSTGGHSSGVMGFLSIRDKAAGATKSGGVTRRAAKMVVLNDDHPEIEDFINWKRREELKAKSLEAHAEEWKIPGIDDNLDVSGMDGEVARTVDGQNSNNSIRVSDKFLQACEDDKDWELKSVVDPSKSVKTLKAKDLLKLMAEAAWATGDPGIQFDDTINEWNPVLDKWRFKATNPCSEFSYRDDTACNLASINLLKLLKNKTIDWESFAHIVKVLITAMDIIVDAGSYPTKEICENSHTDRPLGLGYSNLGSLLVALEVPYASEKGRQIAAVVTAYMHSVSINQSNLLAEKFEAFKSLEDCQNSSKKVMNQHFAEIVKLQKLSLGSEKFLEIGIDRAIDYMYKGVEDGSFVKLRNAQLTNIAPTGTISFMMGCDSFGMEPFFALVSYKTLAGSGEVIKIVNQQVLSILKDNEEAIDYILHTGTALECPHLSEDEQKIYASANEIPYKDHIDMMAAIQPFLSGAISKTINGSNSTTLHEIMNMYLYSWKAKVKCLAIYKDGCKAYQVLTRIENKDKIEGNLLSWGDRKAPPKDGLAFRHKFHIGDGHKGYLHIGLYVDGTPSEIFIKIAPYGGHIGGFLDAWATAVSKGIQRGWPLRDVISTFQYWKFDPAGLTDNPDLGFASSVIDYVVRFLKHFTEYDGDIIKLKLNDLVSGMGYTVLIEEGEETVKVSDPSSMKPKIKANNPWTCPDCGDLNFEKCNPCNNCGYDPGCSGGRMR